MEHNNLKGSLIIAVARAVTPPLFRVSFFRGKRQYSTQIYGIIFFPSPELGSSLGAYLSLYATVSWIISRHLPITKVCSGDRKKLQLCACFLRWHLWVLPLKSKSENFLCEDKLSDAGTSNVWCSLRAECFYFSMLLVAFGVIRDGFIWQRIY